MKKWTEVPAGPLNAAEQRLRVALGNDADIVVGRINKDPSIVERIAKFAVACVKDKLVKPDRAREIMGSNYFGVKEAKKAFRVDPTPEQIDILSEIPFSEEELEQAKETHILAVVFPLSVVEIKEKVGHQLFCENQGNDEEDDVLAECDEAFTERGELSWCLVLKNEVTGSVDKAAEVQKVLLCENDEVSTLRLMVYTIIGHYLTSGEQLFPEVYVRTVSNHLVGLFDSKGLSIHDLSFATGSVAGAGIASNRKVW